MKVKYRFRDLNQIYDSRVEKIKNGDAIDAFDAKFGAAAGYAMDLMDTVRNAGTQRVRLDLTMNTEKNTDKALMVIAMMNISNGMSEEDCLNDLIKKMSSYQLFTLSNLLDQFNVDNEIVYEADMSENLLIRANDRDNKDNVVLFDPKAMMESVSDKCFEFVDVGLDYPGVKIGLDPYKRLVSRELLEKLMSQ